MSFYCSNIPSKMFYESIGADFFRVSRATSKIEDLSRTCKHLLSRMSKQNGKMRITKFYLIKMIQRHQEVFIKSNKSIEFVFSKYKSSKIKKCFSIYIFYTLYIFSYFLFLYTLYILFIYFLYTLYIST